MKNHDNQQPDKQYKVYIPSTHQFVSVTKEFYYEYYRPIWRTQKEAQKYGQCMCPKSKLWRCDGCCLECSYHAPGNVWSLEYEQELMGDKRMGSMDSPDYGFIHSHQRQRGYIATVYKRKLSKISSADTWHSRSELLLGLESINELCPKKYSAEGTNDSRCIPRRI
jgi:hypothetical protein